MPTSLDRRPVEGGWSLQGILTHDRVVRLVIGDTEIARSDFGIVVGRHPALCDRAVEDPTLSRRHCRFSAREGTLYVEDLNSLNGTRIDGADLPPFTPAPIQGGQTLELGRLAFVLRRLGGGEPP